MKKFNDKKFDVDMSFNPAEICKQLIKSKSKTETITKVKT